MLCSKNIKVQINLGLKKIWVQKNLKTEKKIWSKKFWSPKKWVPKQESKKIQGPKNLVREKISGHKTNPILRLKNFRSVESLAYKKF